MVDELDATEGASLLSLLGFGVEAAGDGLRGTATITDHMTVPGTEVLRTSIVAGWADLLCGLVAIEALAPDVPVTVELDIHVYREGPAPAKLTGVGRPLKRGRTIVATEVTFTDESGRPYALATGQFTSVRTPGHTIPTIHEILAGVAAPAGGLEVPWADQIGCQRQGAGVASLTRHEQGLNSAGGFNGALLLVLAEEAALSAEPVGASLASLAMRFFKVARNGPAVATADVVDGLGRIEVRDTGAEGEPLAAVATTRTFGSLHR